MRNLLSALEVLRYFSVIDSLEADEKLQPLPGTIHTSLYAVLPHFLGVLYRPAAKVKKSCSNTVPPEVFLKGNVNTWHCL